MAVFDFDSLVAHRGHHVEVNVYGTHDGKEIYNVAIECMDCSEVLLDFDNEKEKICQCGSCEEIFFRKNLVDGCCPCCGGGNWVDGYIDEPEPFPDGEDSEFTKAEWVRDTRDGDTELGYQAWVKHRRQFYKENPQCEHFLV